MPLNLGIISLWANIALLGTRQGHMLPDHTYLKKSFICSRQYLANAFMKTTIILIFDKGLSVQPE